jgi:hypothetical protein
MKRKDKYLLRVTKIEELQVHDTPGHTLTLTPQCYLPRPEEGFRSYGRVCYGLLPGRISLQSL